MTLLLRGIDISVWQGEIDWERLAPQVDELLVRATMGATGVDTRYAANWRESGWAGIARRGAYHYVTTGVPWGWQRENILRTTGGDFGNVPFTLDCERTAIERERMAAGWRFPREQYTSDLYELCESLRAEVPAGLRLYSNYYEWMTITTQPAWARDFGLHIAGYPAVVSLTRPPRIPPPWSTLPRDEQWAAWQYTASGRLPGIAGNVDQSFVVDSATAGVDAALKAAILERINAIRELL